MQQLNPQDMVHFAIIVDGEVASAIGFAKKDELNIAVFNSEPKFVQVELSNFPQMGSRWDGNNFIAPEVK